jgi:hypothetical protein
MPDPIWEWTRKQVEKIKSITLAATQGAWISIDGGIISAQSQWPVFQPMNPDFEIDRANRAHIVEHDPQAVLADCEAKLRLLEEHRILVRAEITEWPDAYDNYSLIRPHTGRDCGSGCISCHYMWQGAVQAYGTCVTVRLLAWGYQHCDGYQAEWAPPC